MLIGIGAGVEEGQELKAGSTTVANLKNRGTDTSFPIASVLGLGHHNSIMSILWGHGGRSKRNKE